MAYANATRWKAGLAAIAVNAAIILAFVAGLAPITRQWGTQREQGRLSLFTVSALPASATVQHVARPPPLRIKPRWPVPAPLHEPRAVAKAPGRSPVVATPNPATAGDAARTVDFFQYSEQVKDHIKPYHTYPEALRGRPVRGVVLVGFLMRRNGSVPEAWVETSSGSGDLDTAALSTIRRAQPFPAIPAALPDTLTLSIPLSYAVPQMSALR